MRCFKHSNNQKEGSKLKRDKNWNTTKHMDKYWELFHVKNGPR